MSDLNDLMNTIQEYLQAMQDAPRPQARLVIPQWASNRLSTMDPKQRDSILAMIDEIARAHGLATPTEVIVSRESWEPIDDE